MAKILMLSTFLVITSVALIEGVHKGYKQKWLRGEGSIAGRGHVHEGLRLEDGSGWVGIGHTLAEDGNKNEQEKYLIALDFPLSKMVIFFTLAQARGKRPLIL